MNTYKDFVTGKIRYTRGKFSGWTKPSGPLKVHYAIFNNPRGVVLVPEYCLTPETRTTIGNPPKEA